MWRWFLVILLVQLKFISPQPVINENGRSESIIECCPCPKDQDTLAATHKGAFIPGMDWPDSSRVRFGQDQLADTTGEGAFIRSGDVDDCPCRFRDADSSGATSILFPSAVRALWPVVSEKDKPSKEDPKPLLHPEVGFASSVLETLRQATDEEYEDALARDAVKSVMKAADPDLIDVSSALDTAKSIVDVILKPNDLSDSDDGLQEASHVQESRCEHPLGSNRASQENSNSPTLLNKIFAAPKQEPLSLLHHNVWDMDSSTGASNINEQTAESKNIVEGLNLKLNPPLLNLFSKDKNNILSSNNGFALKNMNDRPLPTVESKPLSDLEKHLEILNNKINNSHFDLKLKLEQTKNTLNNNPLSDILQKQNIDRKIKFKPLLPTNKLEFTTIKPFLLKNILKLKDVELIPPVKVNNKELNKAKVNVPQFSHTLIKDSDNQATNLFKNIKSPDLNDILNNGFKFDFKNGIKGTKSKTNIQFIPNNHRSKFDMVDAITSPTEMKIINVKNKLQDREDCNNEEKVEESETNNIKDSETINTKIIEKIPQLNHSFTNECNIRDAIDTETKNEFHESTIAPFKKIASTEILDTVPSPSEIHEFDEEDPDNMNQRFTFKSQTIQDDEVGTGMISSEENSCHEDTEDEELNKEGDNDSIVQDDNEEEDEATNHYEDSGEQQENCFENKAKEEDSSPETTNNVASVTESEKNQSEVTDSFSNSRDIDSNESCINEDFHHSDVKSQDSLPETSNNMPNIIKPEVKQSETSDSSSHTWNSQELSPNESCIDEDSHSEDSIKSHPIFKKPNKLSTLKENILRRLADLKETNKKGSKITENTTAVLNDNNESEVHFSDDCEDESAVLLSKDKLIDENHVNMSDLQNMSNKLLHLSSKRDQEMMPSIAGECEEESLVDFESDEFSERTNDTMFTAGKDNGMIVEDNVDKDENKVITDDLKDDDSISETSNVPDTTVTNTIDTEKCLADSDVQQTLVENKMVSPSRNIEMTVAASNAFEDRIKPANYFKSPLIPDILHNKSPSIVSNLKETSLDINKALNLPSLEDIREGLSNIFEQSRSNVEDLSLIQQGNMNDLDPLVEADTPTLSSIFPPLQPLQDIDLDIFQLKPFTLSGSHELLPKIPRLNLHTYKTKLALPKSMNLKPMKLASSSGDKNGLFGATLTIGSDKILPFDKTPNLLGIHLNNFPSLEELRTTLRENTQNLLATPLETTGRNAIEDTLRSGQTISDNIRSHTKNAVKNIQQTLETTLQDARENDLLGGSVRNPQEFLQAVARRHEDFNDKLKGIHYDLNDRLESLRDRFREQSLLQQFTFPTIKESSVMYKPDRNFKKDKEIFSTSNGKKTNSHFIKKSATPKTKVQKNKTLKMLAASSVPVPKTVEVPKLTPIPTKSSLFNHSNFKTPQLLANKRTLSELLREPISRFQDTKIPLLSRPIDNKIKISFSTTPRPDLSIVRNKPISPKLNSNNHMLKKPNVQNSPIFNTRALYDASRAPSEVSSSKLKLPLSSFNKQTLHTEEEKVILGDRQISKPKFSKSSIPSFRNTDRFVTGNKGSPFPLIADKNPNKGRTNVNKLQGTPILKPVEAPKSKDILTTLREAVRDRLSNVNLSQSANKAFEPKSALDMTKSASENLNTVTYAGQSLKENTSYTCRMMCTRND